MGSNKLHHVCVFIVPVFLFLAFLFTLVSIDTVPLQKLHNLVNYNASHFYTIQSPPSSAQMRIFIGILTLPDLYERRNLLRLVYRTQPPPIGARIDIKFVFCNLTKEDQKVLVALEIMRYDDIIILDCQENMNNGKTYTYFSSLPRILESESYDFAMKADDDTYFRLQYLVNSLRNLNRLDLYYGFVIPCTSMDPFKEYMAGMGFLLSWDIVKWISVSDIPKQHLVGPEDMMVGKWLEEGHLGNNRYNTKWAMYDFQVEPTICSHEFWSETVAVHKLKSMDRSISEDFTDQV